MVDEIDEQSTLNYNCAWTVLFLSKLLHYSDLITSWTTTYAGGTSDT
jgi:hypothetical protein